VKTVVESNLGAILSSLGVVAAAIIGWLGVKHTQRQAAKAQQVTTEIERSKIDAAAYAEARKIWDSLIDDLREQVAIQRTEIADLRREHNSELRSLRERLGDLEQKRAGDRRALHLLTVYARELLRLLKENGIVSPAPPEGLDMDGGP
jgi:uncharacterized protein HemX